MEEQGMIERVARAIMEDSGGGRDRPDFNWRYYESAARAAIKAMRIPSKAMLDAVEAEEEKRGYVASAYESMDAETAWPIMVDAALNEHGEK